VARDRAFGNRAHRAVARAGVVLGDPDDQARSPPDPTIAAEEHATCR
jgi:hypothetical protein